MQAVFLPKYWFIIGKNICLMIQAFLKHGHLLKEINKTYITLNSKNTHNQEKLVIIGLSVYAMSFINLFKITTRQTANT